ncbi:hypothetical protein ACFHW1_04950 [Micromonospora sp. LOL_014]|uniref:tail completion protein gp17 n=1 Tax=Micromonospora sp. LOL_014 TaxID=3345415 RepID=UPI003A873B13
MIQAHADAILDLLRADSELTVIDGPVPQGTVPPYVVVYIDDSDPELPDSRPLTGDSERHVTRGYIHSVGSNGVAVRAVRQRVRAALLDVRPTIAGRSCMPIRREDGQPARSDEETGSPLVSAVDVYRLESVPA